MVVAGAANWDTVMLTRGFPVPGGGVRALRVLEFPGGKGANTAIAASRILGRGSSGVLSAVGHDEAGRRQIGGLEEAGVDTRGIVIMEGEDSGRAFVIVDEASGENSVISYHGALLKLGRGHAKADVAVELVEEAKVVVLMDVPPEFMEELALMASRAGRTLVLAPGLKASESPELVMSLMGSADYVVLNEVEVGGLARASGARAQDVMGQARELAAPAPRTSIVVTLGGMGAVLIGRDGELAAPAVDLRRAGMRPVNTVGCGDAFIGAFAAFKAMGIGDQDALRKANEAGAFKATRLEVQGSPTLEQLAEFEREVGAV